jgi:hypothetical protein
MKLSIQIQLNHHGSTFVPIGAVCVAQTRLAFGKPSKFGNVAVSEVHTQPNFCESNPDNRQNMAGSCTGFGIPDVVTLRQQNPVNSTSVLRQRTVVLPAPEQGTSLGPERPRQPKVPESLHSQISSHALE